MRRAIGMSLVVGSLAVSGVVSAAVRPDHHGHDGGKSCYSTCATRTELRISPDEVTYGSEQDAVFSVLVRPHNPWTPGTPTGTVTVQFGSTVLCQITLSGGLGSCSTTPNALPAAHKPYKITATYGGDGTFSGSTSCHRHLRVENPNGNGNGDNDGDGDGGGHGGHGDGHGGGDGGHGDGNGGNGDGGGQGGGHHHR